MEGRGHDMLFFFHLYLIYTHKKVLKFRIVENQNTTMIVDTGTPIGQGLKPFVCLHFVQVARLIAGFIKVASKQFDVLSPQYTRYFPAQTFFELASYLCIIPLYLYSLFHRKSGCWYLRGDTPIVFTGKPLRGGGGLKLKTP